MYSITAVEGIRLPRTATYRKVPIRGMQQPGIRIEGPKLLAIHREAPASYDEL